MEHNVRTSQRQSLCHINIIQDDGADDEGQEVGGKKQAIIKNVCLTYFRWNCELLLQFQMPLLH